MLEQSSTGRTYTRDAYAPVRRDAHAEVEKLTASSMPAPFDCEREVRNLALSLYDNLLNLAKIRFRTCLTDLM